jgi:hypothetical protein
LTFMSSAVLIAGNRSRCSAVVAGTIGRHDRQPAKHSRPSGVVTNDKFQRSIYGKGIQTRTIECLDGAAKNVCGDTLESMSITSNRCNYSCAFKE